MARLFLDYKIMDMEREDLKDRKGNPKKFKRIIVPYYFFLYLLLVWTFGLIESIVDFIIARTGG